MCRRAGFYPPTSGTAIVNGYDINTDIGHVRRSLGICPQNTVLFNTLNVEEHVQFFARVRLLRDGAVEAMLLTVSLHPMYFNVIVNTETYFYV